MSKSSNRDKFSFALSMVLIKITIVCTLILCQRSMQAQYSSQSILADGQIFKVSTASDGVYKMDYTFLRDQLGIDVNNLDPRLISLYGNGGNLLSEDIDGNKIDDLLENHIIIVGEEDGRFDPGDYILFYGQSPDQAIWDLSTSQYSAPKNIYTDEVHYFLKIQNGHQGLRINNATDISGSTYTSTSFDDYQRIEDEKVNLLDDFNGASGTGQSWFGDLFKGTRERGYFFDAPNAIVGETAHIKAVFAARSSVSSTIQLEVEGQSFSRLIGSVNLTDNESRYARTGTLQGAFEVVDGVVEVDIDYPVNNGNNIGWLDYIDINYRSKLSVSNLPCSDHKSLDHDVSTFIIENVEIEDFELWNITDPLQPTSYTSVSSAVGSNVDFSFESSDLQRFIAFDNQSLLTPKAIGQIDNQDLHQISDVEMIVIYHPDLIDAAELFNEIYNEFGSGAPSPVAIRNFIKMVYDRSSNLEYVLLLGDASFDFKNIKELPLNSNLIPTFETKESLDPIRGFPSDDFYGLLSSGEGGDLKGALDIAIGRLPAKNGTEAMDLVRKIINYESAENRFGDWVNKVTFIADDEDFNIHLNQADQIAEKLKTEYPLYNVDKIYLDAFKQVSTAGGELYPEVQEAINNSLFRGTNVINYMGHGGSTGFAQERILTINDVNNWNNGDRLPLFVTATCSFTGYDDPVEVTAGERAILNPNGGAIALFTTVRAVYSSSNERLTKAVFDNLFEKVDGSIPPIGEILRIAKNSNAADTLGINARKFLLIGDPSLHLARPTYDIATTKINGQPVDAGLVDTLKALDPVTIQGQIEQSGSLLSSFNGIVDITIFDKPRTVFTLGQDNSSFVREFDTQKNIIFKGNATVSNGTFSYSFVVPKDIDYQSGAGKISYYAKSDNQRDATGYYDQVIIGGTSSSPIADDEGPDLELFMNDENFIDGGITGSNPTLLVNLKDDNGINIVGNSIGHDITAVLDSKTDDTFILNEFYKSELDNTKEGTIRFPLSDISEGHHSIEVKAWDIANNSASASLDFVVANDAQSAINSILNYPNPVTDQTTFRIDHNISSGNLDITIDIFTIDGKLVQSLKYTRSTGGGIIDDLHWDGSNSVGFPMNTGIYIFKATVKDDSDSNNKPTSSMIQKMVILK